MENRVDKFAKYLQENCGYPESALLKNTYSYGAVNYGRVEVIKGDVIIQAFVLMSVDHCKMLSKFPFYRTYSQRNKYGYLVPPACNVAVYGNDDMWHIHNAANLRVEVKSPSFLNYEKATDRFEQRFKYLGNSCLYKAVKGISIVLLSLIVLYFIAHVLSTNGLLGEVNIPLDVSVINLFVIIACLLLLPVLLPYIRSLTVGVVGFDLKEEDSKK